MLNVVVHIHSIFLISSGNLYFQSIFLIVVVALCLCMYVCMYVWVCICVCMWNDLIISTCITLEPTTLVVTG